jgi:hypothetical protein
MSGFRDGLHHSSYMHKPTIVKRALTVTYDATISNAAGVVRCLMTNELRHRLVQAVGMFMTFGAYHRGNRPP